MRATLAPVFFGCHKPSPSPWGSFKKAAIPYFGEFALLFKWILEIGESAGGGAQPPPTPAFWKGMGGPTDPFHLFLSVQACSAPGPSSNSKGWGDFNRSLGRGIRASQDIFFRRRKSDPSPRRLSRKAAIPELGHVSHNSLFWSHTPSSLFRQTSHPPTRPLVSVTAKAAPSKASASVCSSAGKQIISSFGEKSFFLVCWASPPSRKGESQTYLEG